MATAVATRIASRQFWAVARWQLLAEGIGRRMIQSWMERGRLHSVYPGVYAWGRAELSTEGQLAAGLLYAGKGSALTAISMLSWRGLLGRRPDRIHIASPNHVRPFADLAITRPTPIHRTEHRGLPLLALPEALLPSAGGLTHNALRLVIARAEYHHVASLSAIEEAIRPGRPGGRAVRAALAAHLPQLARCANRLERHFVLLCESGRVEIPEPNVRKGRFRPDMTWEAQRYIVELDGGRAHSTPAQLANDATRQAWLESQGYRVDRFGPDDVFVRGERTLAVVRENLAVSR